MERMKRPKVSVLPESSLVPSQNLLQPPPNCFTHIVDKKQPYYYVGPNQPAPSEGDFPEGTKVVLLFHDGGATCHVADEQGLYVATAIDGLRVID